MHHHGHSHSHDHSHDHGHDDHGHLEWNWISWKPWLLGLLALVVIYRCFVTVRETEFVLVTQFGKPMYTVTEAGLHPKWPFQSATYFDRRLRIYNPRPSEFLTKDKKNLVIEPYVAWRIEDPKRFVESVGDPGAAEMRLHDIVLSDLAAALGNHELESIISANPETVKASQMMDSLAALTDRKALSEYGIRVVDVRLKRLNLPEQNKQSVFARMRAERERIARQYRAEGEEQALAIRAEADRKAEEIRSEAYKEAEKLKGEGDAESTRVYSAAYSKNPRFYKLLRTLESYKKIFDDKTTAILSSDSELLRVMMRGENAQ
ncbi:MAG: protease modulator HflC [Bryobacteraceae bacterium]